MALSIVNNLAALKAQQSFLASTNHLQKALSHLSTGLRINSAADDPSGLAISERFRTQIRGLARASQNALDAQSMLQTAEGSLGEVHNILQRMRELAVQAANGVLTGSDRQEIQREIDQLKQEIDRIAYSTEFNTKKLLDGSASALWSADSNSIQAIIRGQVAEGNYKLVMDSEPLPNHVLKSDIFRVKEGAVSQSEEGSPNQLRFHFGDGTGEIDALGTLNVVFSFDGGVTTHSVALTSASGTVATDFSDAEFLVRSINAHSEISKYVEAELVSGGTIILRSKDVTDASDGYTLRFHYEGDALATWGGQVLSWAGEGMVTSNTALGQALWSSAGAGIRFDQFADLTTGVGTATGVFGDHNSTAMDNTLIEAVRNAQGLAAGDYEIVTVDNAHLIAATGLNALTGGDEGFLMGAYLTSESTAEITGIGNVAVTENRYVILEVTGAGGDGAVDFRVSWDQGVTWTNYENYSAGDNIDMLIGSTANQFQITSFTGEFAEGDKFLIGLQNQIDSDSNIARLTGPASAFTNINSADGDWDPREQLAGADFRTFTHGLWTDVGDADEVPGSTATLTFARMDEEGRVTFGSMDVEFGTGTFASKSTNIQVLGGGSIAGAETELSKVDRFYDNNGNFVLGENGKWIDIYTADGAGVSIYIDGGDTLQELADKIEEAISLEVTRQGWTGLNLGRVLDSAGINRVTDYVVNPVENTDEAVQGTIVIRSPKQGLGGYLYFSGDEDVMKALSLATIRDPAAEVDPLTISVYNAHTGELIGTDTVSDSILHGVIRGVDVIIDSNVDVSSSWNNVTKQIVFYSSPGEQTAYLHLVRNATDFQIGANPGQTMNAFIGQMDTVALGVHNVLVINQPTAAQAMSRVDEAIQRVSSERARIGAYINRLDHTIANLAVQEENQVAAESTIRDLDMAKAISEMTQYQILQQVGVAMLAQANTLSQTVLTLLR